MTRLRSGLDVVALSNGEELHYQGISNAGVPVRTVQAFVRSGQAERQVLMLVLERRRKLTFDQVYDTIGLGTPEHCIAPLEHIRRFGQDA